MVVARREAEAVGIKLSRRTSLNRAEEEEVEKREDDEAMAMHGEGGRKETTSCCKGKAELKGKGEEGKGCRTVGGSSQFARCWVS